MSNVPKLTLPKLNKNKINYTKHTTLTQLLFIDQSVKIQWKYANDSKPLVLVTLILIAENDHKPRRKKKGVAKDGVDCCLSINVMLR